MNQAKNILLNVEVRFVSRSHLEAYKTLWSQCVSRCWSNRSETEEWGSRQGRRTAVGSPSPEAPYSLFSHTEELSGSLWMRSGCKHHRQNIFIYWFTPVCCSSRWRHHKAWPSQHHFHSLGCSPGPGGSVWWRRFDLWARTWSSLNFYEANTPWGTQETPSIPTAWNMRSRAAEEERGWKNVQILQREYLNYKVFIKEIIKNLNDDLLNYKFQWKFGKLSLSKNVFFCEM